MIKEDKLPPYFVNYMEEKFERLEDRFDNNISEIKGLLKGEEGLVEKVEKHDKWIEGFEARMGVVVTILGGIFALAFTLVRDVVANILKVK